MHYLSKDELLATGASQLLLLGKLYNQAYAAHRNEGYGQAMGEFNGKEISCTISNVCINCTIRRNTLWRVNGKRTSQKRLMEVLCKEM